MISHNDRDRLTRMETILERLDVELLGGDGKEGFIEKTNSRLSTLDRERAWLKGAFYVISTVVTALGLGGVFHIVSGLDKTK